MKPLLPSIGITAFAAATSLILSNPAQAFSFVPQEQGEIETTNLGCLPGVSCISGADIVDYFGKYAYSVESLVDSTTGHTSRLFVDYFGDGDAKTTYTPTNGSAKIVFDKKDAGTNPEGFWFRPVETSVNNKGIETREESGQLEVGTFKFTFAKTLSELTIAYFDTESKGTTGVLATDGNLFSGSNLVPSGANNNLYYQTWKDVNYITLKLGQDTAKGTGDGVDFQIDTKAVPEPGSMVGVVLVGLASGFGALRNKLRQAA